MHPPTAGQTFGMSERTTDERHDDMDEAGTGHEFPSDRIVPQPGEPVGDDDAIVATPAPNGLSF